MNIVVWGINYAPEQTGIAPYNTGLCEYLVASGHAVRMLTTFAYYPEWRKTAVDRNRIYRTDTLNGVTVYRCWHYVPPRPTALKRMLHEASFVATSFLRVLFAPAADVVIVVSPPLLLGFAASLLRLLRRSPYVFHVQDMQPDAAVMLGLLKRGILTRILYGFERWAQRHAALVSGITPGMLRMFTMKGVRADRLVLFPNWMPETNAVPPEASRFRREHGVSSDEFLAVYSGNLGKKQGLNVILDAAARLKDGLDGVGSGSGKIRFVIAGDGVEKPALTARIARERLDNVLLLPLQPRESYRCLLADANVCLVTQQPGSGALFFPSKLLDILAHAKPVVAVADRGGELESAVLEGHFGWVVPPGSPDELANTLLQAATDRAALTIAARSGAHWVGRFERERVLDRFETALLECLAGKRDRPT
ncbi:WcaI family glycosyltransferase [Opitutales bacterium ASA1]|uniref:WcaI family glycosyltransferase n=1 Tax=Congregicoccus parvus TaxID=3081749 RepID=UPI002B2DF1B3|nr:WcaI family glycosyltransferase [Opitutales bacterium ASA1]